MSASAPAPAITDGLRHFVMRWVTEPEYQAEWRTIVPSLDKKLNNSHTSKKRSMAEGAYVWLNILTDQQKQNIGTEYAMTVSIPERVVNGKLYFQWRWVKESEYRNEWRKLDPSIDEQISSRIVNSENDVERLAAESRYMWQHMLTDVQKIKLRIEFELYKLKNALAKCGEYELCVQINELIKINNEG